jgi:two-component system response regulator RstA
MMKSEPQTMGFSHSLTQQKKKLLVFTPAEGHNPELTDILLKEGFHLDISDSLEGCAATIELHNPDLILFNTASPSMELISLCHSLRQQYPGPIVVLSDTHNEMLQVLALEMGVDDFLTKPLSNAYILAKIRALLRRCHELRNHNHKKVHLGELTIDAERREVMAKNEVVDLTTREFDVLWCLAQNNRKVLSRDDIHRQLYNSEYNGFDRSIDIYISRIRQKIGDDPNHPRYLKTVRGSGYLLADERPTQ